MRSRLKASPLLFCFFLFVWTSLLFSQERFRKSAPSPDPLPELNLPKIETVTLSNGLTLSVIQTESHPLISVRLIMFAGEFLSPEAFPGTADFAAHMVIRRSVRKDPDEIEEMVESIGGRLFSSVTPDYALFTFTFIEEFLDQGLEILSELILQPAFTEVEIGNVKRSLYYDLVNRSSDPEYLAKRQLLRSLFKDHPYIKSIYNEDVIRNLNERTLKTFFDDHYRPNHAWIILTGNLSLGTASRKVSRYFQTWQSKNRDLPPLPSPTPNDEVKVCFIQHPEEKQATIYMGNILTPLPAADVFPLLVMNQVLGGTATSRLFMNLRESKGYAYYTFSQLELFEACGVFYIRARVRPEVIEPAVSQILSEMEKITRQKIPSFEIEQAKSYLIGNFPLNIQTLNNLSQKVVQVKALQLGEEHWEDYYENIMLIDSTRVYQVVQKHNLLAPVVVIVGDKNLLTEHLMEFDKVHIYDQNGILQYTISKETTDETR